MPRYDQYLSPFNKPQDHSGSCPSLRHERRIIGSRMNTYEDYIPEAIEENPADFEDDPNNYVEDPTEIDEEPVGLQDGQIDSRRVRELIRARLDVVHYVPGVFERAVAANTSPKTIEKMDFMLSQKQNRRDQKDEVWEMLIQYGNNELVDDESVNGGGISKDWSRLEWIREKETSRDRGNGRNGSPAASMRSYATGGSRSILADDEYDDYDDRASSGNGSRSGSSVGGRDHFQRYKDVRLRNRDYASSVGSSPRPKERKRY